MTEENKPQQDLYREWAKNQTAQSQLLYTDPFTGETDTRYTIQAFHKICISGTMDSVLLGANPWASKQEIFDEINFKKDDRFVDEEKRFTFELGHHAESLIAKEFSRITHIKLAAGTMLVDTDHKRPWSGCQIDFLTVDGEPMECKTASHSAGWGKGCLFNSLGDVVSEDSRIPDYYMIQCQKQMWIKGVQRMWLSVWMTFERGIRIFRLTADPALQQKIIEAEDDFMFNHLVPNVGFEEEPVPVKTAPEVDDKTCFANDEFNSLLMRYKELKAPYKTVPVAVRKEMNGIVDKLAQLMGDKTRAIDTDGNELCHFTTSQMKPTFNEKKFADEHPDLYKEYMQEGKTSTKFFMSKFVTKD